MVSTLFSKQTLPKQTQPKSTSKLEYSTPYIKQAEPEFIITVLGTEMTRHIGVSQENLQNKLTK